MGKINYRAVHTKTRWRKVNNHKTIDAAIEGKDGAAGLFARKVRINYETHGDPLYVIVWEEGAQSGVVIKADLQAPKGMRQVSIPIADILVFEDRDDASDSDLEKLF